MPSTTPEAASHSSLFPAADPSSSASLQPGKAPPMLSLFPRNVVSVFLARFHVRHGNQIEYQWPAPRSPSARETTLVDLQDEELHDAASAVDLDGVEWKVLPSGGHLIESDVVYFEPKPRLVNADAGAQDQQTRGRVGVACFRNLKLDDAGGGDSSSTKAAAAPTTVPKANAQEQGLDQRGARMISVGLILSCPSDEAGMSPTAHQLAIVPHLDNLDRLAEQLVRDPTQTQLLRTYYEAHAESRLKAQDQPNSRAEGSMSVHKMRQLRIRRRCDPKNLYHDPTAHLAVLCSALGPLLPVVLKRLMIQGHRLLIFSPAPPLVQVAFLGYNLADLVTEALPSKDAHGSFVPVRVRGQVGVHDIIALEEEERHRHEASRTAASYTSLSHHYIHQHDGADKGQEQRQSAPSWIAWTTDKLLLEKPHLFDSVLDLSTLIAPGSDGRLEADSLISSSAYAKLLRISRTPAKASASHAGASAREKVEAKKQSWTTREFATFNELDAQAERHADRFAAMRNRGKRHPSKRKASKTSLRRSFVDGRGGHASTASGTATGASSRKRSRIVGRSRESLDRREAPRVLTPSESAVSQWRGGCSGSTRRTRGGVVSAILAFLRYWLAGWWFLPSHWRYDLPSAYVLPLGIRGDGGVRSSIMIMPASDDEHAIDDEEDDDEDEESGSDASSSSSSFIDEHDEHRGERGPRNGDNSHAQQERASPETERTDQGGADAEREDDDSASSTDAGQAEGSATVTASTASPVSAPGDDDEDDDDEGDLDLSLMGPPDPLLAAVGASVPFHHAHDGRHSPASVRRRGSASTSLGGGNGNLGDGGSHHGAAGSQGRRTPSRRIEASVSSSHGYARRRLSFDRFGNHIPLSASSLRGEDDDDGGEGEGQGDEDEDGDEDGEAEASAGRAASDEALRLMLSDSLWTVWHRWTCALVQGLEEIMARKRDEVLAAAADAEHQGGPEQEGERTRLLADGGESNGTASSASSSPALVVRVGTKEMAWLGLSVANQGDVELVQSLARRMLERREARSSTTPRRWSVEVDKVWPVFGWFL
ncbi:hypothetical protein ACQY0O_008064 [Thecaphora frezii]